MSMSNVPFCQNVIYLFQINISACISLTEICWLYMECCIANFYPRSLYQITKKGNVWILMLTDEEECSYWLSLHSYFTFLFHLINFLFNHQSWFLDFPQHSWTSLWSLRFEYCQNLWIQSTGFVLQVLRVAGLINPPIPHAVTFTCLETRIFLHITSTLYISLQKQKQKFHAWYHIGVSFTVFYGYVHAPYRLLILL